jgi:hypothetical protein
MSTRSAHTEMKSRWLKALTHACAERGPLEAAPGKERIENEELRIERALIQPFYISNFQFSIPK